jgi:hypothetical protein
VASLIDAAFPRKLGVKDGHTVLLIALPDEVREALASVLPRNCRLLDAPDSAGAADVIVLWADETTAGRFPELQRLLKPDGSLWAVIPKKAKDTPEALLFTRVQEAALATTDLVDNKTLTFSETHYGIRFVIRKEKRGA